MGNNSFGADSDGVDSASSERPLEDWVHRPHTRATLAVVGAFILLTVAIGIYGCLTIDPDVTISVNPSGNRRWNLGVWGVFIPTVAILVVNGRAAGTLRFDYAETRRAFVSNLVSVCIFDVVIVGAQAILIGVFYEAAALR